MADKNQGESPTEHVLLRVLGLPILILYGVGVTVGAGIFVRIGNVVEVAGSRAPIAFILAAIVAGITAVSYATLSRGFPQAAGASLYAKVAFGRGPGMIVGLGVALTAIISSATIVLGFAGYVIELINLPTPIIILLSVGAIGILVQRGVKESVGVAAVLTLVEIGILLAVITVGVPTLTSIKPWAEAFSLSGELPIGGIVSAAILAFFAFIGFEDLVNMSEEALAPEHTMGKARLGTLLITTAVYILLAVIAVGVPDRDGLIQSTAPVAAIWTQLTGFSSSWLTSMALIAVINGVIVQIVMASRLLYGMARAGMMPTPLAKIGSRHTPVTATWFIVAVVVVLALVFPIGTLARATTTVTLLVFAAVNLSLIVIGNRQGSGPIHARRWVGVVGFCLTFGLALNELVSLSKFWGGEG